MRIATVLVAVSLIALVAGADAAKEVTKLQIGVKVSRYFINRTLNASSWRRKGRRGVDRCIDASAPPQEY